MSELRGFEIKNADGSEVNYDALGEKYKNDICYCDIDGFYIGEDGALVLMDDCGGAAWVDRSEYVVTPQTDRRAGWVKCSERLPDKGECLVVHADGTVHPASVVFGGDFAHCTHWMPLPEPPEEDE